MEQTGSAAPTSTAPQSSSPSAPVGGQSQPQAPRGQGSSGAPASNPTSIPHGPLGQAKAPAGATAQANQLRDSATSPQQGAQSQPGADGTTQVTDPNTGQVLTFTDEQLDSIVEQTVQGRTERKSLREWLGLSNQGFVAQRKMQAAAQSIKKAQWLDQVMQLSEKDPMQAASLLLGDKLDAVVQAAVSKKLERNLMTEEERRIAEREERINAREREIEQKAYVERMQAQKQIHAEVRASTDRELEECLAQNGMPVNSFTRGVLAHKLLANFEERREAGLPPLKAADVYASMETELLGLMRDTLSQLLGKNPAKLQQALGNELFQQMSQIRVSQVLHQDPPPSKRPAESAVTNKIQKGKALTQSEWDEYHEKLRAGLA